LALGARQRDASTRSSYPCSDRAEAKIIVANTRNRDEQRHVCIIDRRPALSSGVAYSLVTKVEASRW
jgi:hypothetical protein